MKLCWLLTTFQSVFSSLTSLTAMVSDKHVPECRFQSVSPGAGALVWFSCSRGESEWRILLWCLAAQTVAARHLSSCWRVLLSSAPRVRKNTRAAATQDSGLHTRRGLPTDQTLLCTLQIIESHWGMRLLETARDVKHRWWAVVINRMTFY